MPDSRCFPIGTARAGVVRHDDLKSQIKLRQWNMKRYRYAVTGIVQGVGFRYFTQKTADGLHLTGWVRNAEDGSVEGEVQGDEISCSAFFEKLRRGPTYAHIEKLIMNECLVVEKDRRFEIIG
jgi:acylphosphatase